MNNYEDKVLGLVARPDYKPMTLKVMSRRFGVGADQYPEFRSTVKSMIRAGQLDVAKDKTLSKPSEKGAIVGTFRRSSKGFGFVRPRKSEGRGNDIFIPPDAGLDASTGDEVAVKITKKARTPGYNNEGRIVRVLTRATGLFVGTYYEENASGFVKVDGTTFHGPIPVGDPGAKQARPGDKVTIELVRYPTPDRQGEGVITEVLGPRGQPGVDTISIIRALNIPDTFDDDVLQEARDQAVAFKEDEIGDRVDLRDVLTITIDPATARDFDDAISLSRDDRGYWSLGVHIADVGHFVQPNSELDRTARKRGTSVYLPDRVIPMLPEVLSNSLASLQAGKTRYTLSAFIEFDSEGVRTDRKFARTAIRVDQRFAYEQAFVLMKDPTAEMEGVSTLIRDQLVRMLELAMILRRRRFKRGALELNMPQTAVELGAQGEVVGAHLELDDESHQVIEEFMLAANEAVASHLTEKGVAFLRRGHDDPEPAKLKKFAEFARSLGFEIDSPQSRFELQRILKESADRPERHAVHYGLLRSLKQATYTPEREGHYALASEDYCHFTSPIRRYPDLQVHRQLVALLAGKKPKTDEDELAALAEHCTKTEKRAEAAERELIKVKLLTYLEGHIGEKFHAIVIGVEDFGAFCQLVEFPVDGLLHVTSLADDFYYLESETHTLIGRRTGNRIRLGDRLEVAVARVDVDRRSLDLVPADRPDATLPVRREPQADSAGPSRPDPRFRARPTKEKARPKPKNKKKGGRRGG